MLIKTIFKAAALLGVVLSFSNNGLGQANGNPCANAPMLSVSETCTYTTGTTAGATEQTNAANFGTPGCGSMGEDVWYAFIAPPSGSVAINFESVDFTDGVAALYESDCVGSYTEIDCDDDGGPGSMPVLSSSALNPGQTYFIRIWEYAGGSPGDFNVCVQSVTAPEDNDNCAEMNPICSDAGASFIANTGVANASTTDPGNDYGCLSTSPNPSWYFLEISQAGDLNMNLTAGSDIDYIIWGPYGNLSAAEGDCGDMGYNGDNIIDCSYSSTNDEYPTITNAQVGEVYVLLITNYADVTQQVDLVQVNFGDSGAGETDCDIVFQPCSIDNFTANVSACDPATNTYTVDGVIDLTDAPTSGTLTVEDCNGNTQVFNAPFAASINYSLTGLIADGAACTVTASFSADLACTETINYTAPTCPNCLITNFTANISACDPATNTYTVTGTVDITDAPASGTLTISDCNGNEDVFSAPFAASYNYTVTSNTPDGAACDITAVFSADPACTANIPYTAPECICNIDNFTVSVSACDGANEYELTGTVEFTSGPTTGSLIVEDCNGNQDVFDASTITSPVNYTISNLTADGAACDVTVYFTDDVACTANIPYDAPMNCACNVDVGTFTVDTDGVDTGNDITLCYGNGFTFTANGDFIPPTDLTGSDPSEPLFDPTIYWMVYSCPPTVGVTPAPGVDVFTDPCFVTMIAATDIGDLNDMGFINSFAPGTFPDNEVYFVPITIYSEVDNIYTYTTNAAGMPCYDLGTPIQVQYLPEMTETTTEDCQAGTLETTINGGLPELDGSDFTASNLVPATASFTNTTTSDGGTIGVSGLVDGDNYSFDITDGNGCPITISGTFTGTEDPTFDYAQNTYCANEADPSANITGDTGGTFSSTGGLVINAGTGLIDLDASTAGTYTITYTTPDPICFSTSTFDITINAVDDPSFTVTDFCEGDANNATITGTTGGTFAFNPTVADGATIDPATGEITNGVGGTTYTVEYTTPGICPLVSTQDVTVNVVEDPSFTVTDFCEGDVNAATITGSAGGTFAFNPAAGDGATINAATGEITNEVGGTTYTVEYSFGGACPQLSTQDITVNALDDPSFTVTDFCEGDANNSTITGTTGGTFAFNPTVADGATIDPATGEITNGVGGTTYTVEYTTAGICPLVSTQDVTVNVVEDPSFTVTDFCEGDVNAATITGSAGGTFSFNPAAGDGATINAATGEITNEVGGTTYTVEYSFGGACPQLSTQDITVNALDDPSFTVTDFCEGDANNATITGTTGGTFAFNPTVADGATIDPATGEITNGVGGTTYTVEYTTAGICPLVSTQDVTVNVVEDPSFTVTDFCEGDVNAATITGSTGGTFAFNPAAGDGATINAATGEITNEVGGTTYTVEYSFGGACPQLSTQDITVNALDDPSFTVTDFCEGDANNATITGTTGGTFAFNPTVTDGATIDAATGEITNGVGGTTYTVEYTTAGICPLVSTQDVTVNGLPTPTIDGPLEYCSGTSTTLSADQVYTNYNWSTGDNTQNATVTIADNPISITVTDANGCIATSPSVDVLENSVINTYDTLEICQGDAIDIHGNMESVAGDYPMNFVLPTGCDSTSNIHLIVNALPAVDAGTDVVLCEDVNTVTLSGAGADSYVWDNSVNDGIPFTQAVGTVTYTVTGTDVNGCINSDAIDVTINPMDDPSFTLTDYCEGDANNATITGTTGGTFAFNPLLAGTITINPTTGEITNGVGGTTYTVEYTTSGTCQMTSTQDVLVNIVEDPSFTLTDYCDGEVNNATITGSTGGTFAFFPAVGDGATINPTTGSITNGVGGTTYTVEYSFGGPCPVSLTQDVTVNALDIPTFTLADYCEGDANNATITGTTGGTFAFNPVVGDGATINAATGEITNGVGGTTYTVEYTTTGICPQSSTEDVTVNGLPTPTITGGLQYCLGTSAILSADQVYAGYNWSNGTTAQNASFTDVDNPITITVTDANGCIGTSPSVAVVEDEIITDHVFTICDGDQINIHGNMETVAGMYSNTFTTAQGCDSTSNVQLVVNALPAVDAGTDITVCEDANTIVLSGSGAITYVWDNTVTNNTPFTQAPGSITYTVTGTDANGCENTDVVDVTVNQLPGISAGDDEIVCDGVEVTLSGSMLLNTGTAPVNYDWTAPVVDGVAFTQGVGTVTYTVTGTDANGCVSTDDVNVTVNPLPNVSAGADQTICEGTEITLNGQGAVSYDWNNGVTNGVPFTPFADQVYTVTGTDANGCENTADISITVEVNPVPDFVGNDLSGCAPHTVVFTNNTPGNITGCTWDFGNGATAGNCGPVTITYPVGGTYSVSLTTTSANGCTGTTTFDDYIYVEDAPIASFFTSGNEVSALNPEVQFTNTSTGATNYEWSFGDASQTTTIENPSHTFPEEDQANYIVQLVAYSSLGCSDTAYATITVNEELIYYIPNTFTPDDDDYNETFKPVFTDGYDPYDYTLLIFNRWGEIIFESHDTDFGWNGKYGGIEVQDGTYTWKIEFKTTRNDERIDIHGHVNKIR